MYLVDCCSGTKYYKKYRNAVKAFYSVKDAHTLAKEVDGIWYVLSEMVKVKDNAVKIRS